MLALRTATRLSSRAMPMRLVAPSMAISRRFMSNEISKSSLPFTYSSDVKVKYSEDHEWLALHGDGTAFVGITKYAADALGDATYVEVGEAGLDVSQGESIGSVESVKSASELYSPADGEIIEGNSELESNPALVNEDPLGAGWFTKMKIEDTSAVDELMNLEAYEEFLKSD